VLENQTQKIWYMQIGGQPDCINFCILWQSSKAINLQQSETEKHMHDVYHPAQTITLTANNLKKIPCKLHAVDVSLNN
jgi:hypothetical protein